MKNKGVVQGNAIIGGMVMLMIVAFLGLVSVTVYDSIAGSVVDGMSAADATNAANNFTDNFMEGEQLASNIPIVLAAGLLLMVIMGLALYVRA
jgi:hypothetical protein